MCEYDFRMKKRGMLTHHTPFFSYKQAYEDAKISMKMKEKMEKHSTSRDLQKQISDKLLSSLMADHRKHISRCKYWMGKANFEQGDYEGAVSGTYLK